MKGSLNGKMLHYIRNLRQLSQRRLSEISKVSYSTIQKLEKSGETHSCWPRTVRQLAEALKVDPNDLAEDQFDRVVEIGEEIELRFHRRNDIDLLRRTADRLIDLATRRERILNGSES
jgi:transcriptional regulator with XRE-family HTH domain